MVAGAAPAARPGPGPRYDPFAASHGLLIDEAQAGALAAGSPVLEAAVEAAPRGDVEVTVTFSKALAPPARGKKDGKAWALPPATEAPPAAAVPPAWIVPAAALIAFLAAGGGAAWFLLPGAGPTLTTALAALTPPLEGARREAPAPVPSPRPAEPASPSPARAAALPGSDGASPRRADPVEPARQRATADAPSPPRDSRAGARRKPMASRRLVGQR
jgi:hypothetical protein